MSFITQKPILSLSALLGTAAIAVSGIAFLNSRNNYANYDKSYENMKKELLADFPQPPEEVIKDNEYVTYDDISKSITRTKSSYKNKYILSVYDAEIDLDEGEPEFVTYGDTSWEVANGFKKGGSISYNIKTASYGMSDIDVYLGLGEVKGFPIKNLIDAITIKVNGYPVITVDFEIPQDGALQQLVLKNTKLVKGENKIEFATSVGDGSSANNFIMPAIAAVTFITDVERA